MAYRNRYYGSYKSGGYGRNRPRKPAPPDVRIEYPSAGATYSRDEYGVYEYDEYPSTSVLAGQQRRIFRASYKTLEEARAAYPQASEAGCGYQPPYLGHLPDDDY